MRPSYSVLIGFVEIKKKYHRKKKPQQQKFNPLKQEIELEWREWH